jgi:hypothetical protein
MPHPCWPPRVWRCVQGLDEGWLVEMPNTTAPYTPYQQPECALPAPPAGQANGTAPIVVAQAGAAP